MTLSLLVTDQHHSTAYLTLYISEYKYILVYVHVPIQLAARSKAWVCGRSLAGIVGSNPAGDKFVSRLLRDVCRQVEATASG